MNAAFRRARKQLWSSSGWDWRPWMRNRKNILNKPLYRRTRRRNGIRQDARSMCPIKTVQKLPLTYKSFRSAALQWCPVPCPCLGGNPVLLKTFAAPATIFAPFVAGFSLFRQHREKTGTVPHHRNRPCLFIFNSAGRIGQPSGVSGDSRRSFLFHQYFSPYFCDRKFHFKRNCEQSLRIL